MMGSAHPFGIFKLNDEAFPMTHRPLLNGVTYRVDLGFKVDG